jgi:hypothetical protein
LLVGWEESWILRAQYIFAMAALDIGGELHQVD